jgi:hypothetical protein
MYLKNKRKLKVEMGEQNTEEVSEMHSLSKRGKITCDMYTECVSIIVKNADCSMKVDIAVGTDQIKPLKSKSK